MTPPPLWLDIQAQGDNLHRVINHFYGAEAERLNEASKFLRNDRPIVFIGMGSAAYLCMAAEYYLGQHGRYASVINASDALYTLFPALKHVNVVFNTRSGKTVEVVKLGQALAEAGVPFLAITNEPDSPLAQLATHILWSDSRKDDLVSINIVTSMMTTTLLLAANVVGQTETLQADLEKLPVALEETLRQAWQQAETITDLFETTRPIYLLHRGVSKGAAYCGRLVLEEVARHPATAMEAGEFRQGPIEVMDESFGAILFAAQNNLVPLNLALADNIQANGGRVLVVAEPNEVAETIEIPVMPLAPVSSLFRPVLEVVPTQVLAYSLAERQGYEPGTVRYLSKIITSEAGIPKLNQ